MATRVRKTFTADVDGGIIWPLAVLLVG